jgi:preprotein translocase subunit SecD
MSGNLVRRLLVILAAMGLASYFLAVNGIKRGLDLQGGMYLAVQVSDPEGTMTEQAKKDATDQALDVIRNRIDQFGVTEPIVQKHGDDRIIVELAGIRDEERAKNIVKQTAYLEFQHVLPVDDVVTALPRIDRAILQVRPDLVKPDTAKAKQGPSLMDELFKKDSLAADSTKSDSAAVSNRVEDRPLTSLLNQGQGEGEFAVEAANVKKVQEFLALPEVQRLLPRGEELRWGAESVGQGTQLYRPLYVLQSKPFMTGEEIQDAQAGKDPQYNYTVVTFQLRRKGGRTFEKETAAHIQDRIAIVLDEQVKSAPTVQSRISTNGQIEMGSSPISEANDLALVLRSGALPAKIEVIEQRVIGPSLGADSVKKGQMAAIIGIVFVIFIMVGIYRFSGVLAVVALAIYVLLVLGGLAAFGATLTAPGIAGFVLSVGMAVDANILIFERIREEMLAGKSQRIAVEEGFKHALSAIIDSNLSSIITALILYQVGTGPVRGFAVTLILGVTASFFTAVFITRTFFMVYMDRKPAAAPISI